MGLMSFLGKGPLSERQIVKAVKLATNPFAQPDVRVRELERLFEDGSLDAISGALRRFSVNSNGHIADEDEKKWLEDQLVEFGDGARGPLQLYIRQEKQLTYALRAYRRLCGDEEAITLFLECLHLHGPEAYKESEAKLQLVWELSEDLNDPRVLASLVVFLEDHSDDVRWAVLDLLERGLEGQFLTSEARALYREQMSTLIFDNSVGPRIHRRVAEFMSEKEWAVDGTEIQLPTLLEEDFFLDKKRFLRRRLKRSS